MSSKNIYVCDICGKEFGDWGKRYHVAIPKEYPRGDYKDDELQSIEPSYKYVIDNQNKKDVCEDCKATIDDLFKKLGLNLQLEQF
jgi:DNA-directed RNA polymerase subunit RPC12/RpoP